MQNHYSKISCLGPVALLALTFIAAGMVSANAEPGQGAVPHYSAAESGAEVVTETNLLVSDRFWPYGVSLVADHESADGKTLKARTRGVLIRVEEGAVARIDFGRNGVREVPVAETDIVDLANQIRTGRLNKLAPNFSLAVGRSLADPATEALLPFRFRAQAEDKPFVACVFADPFRDGFEDLSRGMAPLETRDSVQVVLFPRGDANDFEVGKRLRDVDWRAPFALHLYSVPHSRALIGVPGDEPMILILSRDGRVMLRTRWSSDSISTILAALDHPQTDS